MPNIQITIPEDAWEPTGVNVSWGRLSLKEPLHINGGLMHLEAIAVKTDEQGQQAAADADFEEDLVHLQAFHDTAFQTETINGREYVLVMLPGSA